MKKVYIVGAHSRGRTLKVYLENIYEDIKVVSFLVDDLSENNSEEDGIPVKSIDETIDISLPVYIGTRGIYHDKITEELRSLGVKEIIPVTVELDTSLRNEYVKKAFEKGEKTFLKFSDLPNETVEIGKSKSCIYVAGSVFDAQLQTPYEFLKEEHRIQVGAALTEQCLEDCEFFDNIGENISEKNKQFCELTAHYWIWKNATDDVVGLVHYRRHFLLPDNWSDVMAAEKIDVILPVPLFVAPSLEENYKLRHMSCDWEAMMSFLQENYAQDYGEAKVFFEDGLYSPCNMLIARKAVFDSLCEWLFPILDYVVEQGGVRADKYQNRYPGFLAERLISFFFEKNRNKYKVVYADKNFLS